MQLLRMASQTYGWTYRHVYDKLRGERDYKTTMYNANLCTSKHKLNTLVKVQNIDEMKCTMWILGKAYSRPGGGKYKALR